MTGPHVRKYIPYHRSGKSILMYVAMRQAICDLLDKGHIACIWYPFENLKIVHEIDPVSKLAYATEYTQNALSAL
jgi:hypothetical protein